MHETSKKAAVAKYGKMKLEGTPIADIKTAVEADSKKFKPEEVDEIMEAVLTYDGAPGPTPPQNSGNKSHEGPAPETKNKKYELWEVEPQYIQHEAAKGKNAWTEFKGYEKVRKIKETTITEERAATLNDQATNTKQYYYEVK